MPRPNRITPRQNPRSARARNKKYRAFIREKISMGMTNEAGGQWIKPSSGRLAIECESIQTRAAYNSARNIRSRSERGKYSGSRKFHA